MSTPKCRLVERVGPGGVVVERERRLSAPRFQLVCANKPRLSNLCQKERKTCIKNDSLKLPIGAETIS